MIAWQVQPTAGAAAARAGARQTLIAGKKFYSGSANLRAAAPAGAPSPTACRRGAAALLSRAEGDVGAAATVDAPGTSGKTVPTSNVWELDFCSRPMLDERGKKMWELLICNADRSFEYAVYFPNNKINSAEVWHRQVQPRLHPAPRAASRLRRPVPAPAAPAPALTRRSRHAACSSSARWRRCWPSPAP
jgi:hypothetical protein